MCDHHFLPTKNKKISYCKLCGNISYNKISLLSIPSKRIQILNLNPLSLKFRPYNFKVDFSNFYQVQYLKSRINAINFLKIQTNFFSFSKVIFYKALTYLDYIYLNNNISIDSIDKKSLICIHLALLFNECCTKNNLFDLKNFKSNLLNMNFFKQFEMLCLKLLNYDLGKYSILDYINLFFSLGIIYPNNVILKNIDIHKIYFNCLNLLDIIIKDNQILNFSTYILGLSIIKLVLENFNCFNSNIFKKVYGINFKKEKYISCVKILNLILSKNTWKNINYPKVFFLNNEKKKYITKINSRDSTFENSENNDILN